MRKIYISILVAFLLFLIGCANRKEAQLKEIYSTSREIAQEGEFREAINYIESEVKESQRDEQYYFFHGLYLELDDPIYNAREVIADYLKAYEFDPIKYEIVLSLGRAYGLVNNTKKAIYYLEKAVELCPEFSDKNHPYGLLSIAYLESHQIDKAFSAVFKAIELSPDDAWNYLNKGLILSEKGDLDSLTDLYHQAVKMDSGELEFHKYYGNRLIEMGFDDMAIEHFQKFLEIDENYYWCYAELGYINMVRGDWNDGKELLDRSYSIIKRDSSTLKYLAFFYYFNESNEKAFDFYVDYRLSMEKKVPIYRPKSVQEIKDFFTDDRLFIRLENAEVDSSFTG